ncbi:uncharacterized protein EDB93DRAFT_1231126 [Suillus bovinus]|uniref:uncharacterized protein n=1 Tax=Suillus bovinus TaxID=48563 RepID=UPI001B86E600|nr:uncharacterized protein EDB93DRAFT_1231126 [Suillus bovinus]KAG2137889.1 hypothetical protein EDB93DRAFT_1231126 [Suillus bovinus]
MHQALLVPEVLLEIFAYVNIIPSTQTTSTQKLLAALARTCKIFHEPAMNLLWTEIHGLEPLLGCVARLHPLIYEDGTRWDDSDKPWAKGVEPLSAHESHQFLRHSSRIRTLNIKSEHPHLLSVIPAGACVFPKLKSLSISSTYLNLFLPCMLHRCHLLSVDEGLQSFVTRCIAMEHLCIYSPLSDDDGMAAGELSLLSDRIHWCTRLVTLSCPMLDWSAWKHLSCLPTLLKLEIEEGCIDPPSLPKQDIVNLSFLNITSLSFRQLYDAADIITVMQHSQFPSLKEFEFRAEFLSSEEAEQLFHALSHCNACRTLEEISIFSYDNDFMGPEYDEFLTPIPHLLCFTQLRTLTLIFKKFSIYPDNDMFLQAMSNWPHIRTLRLEFEKSFSEVTLRGLLTALGLCPQLHTLQVAVNLATIDVDPDAEPIQHTSLRSLNLEKSKFQIADAETLARIISAWLPCVDQVHTNRCSPSWSAVNRYLGSLREDTARASVCRGSLLEYLSLEYFHIRECCFIPSSSFVRSLSLSSLLAVVINCCTSTSVYSPTTLCH